jgi:hypothetical protein
VKSFKLSFTKAESLKRTADSSKYARQIFQAMRPIFADLVQELQRSIGFYSSTHRDTEIEKVVAFGNAFKLPGLRKYLQQNLGLTIVEPKEFEKAAPSAAANTPEFKENLVSFGVAYGLALQGLDLSKVNSNLLPTEIAKQIVWRKKRPAFAVAAACLVLAGGMIWFRQTTDMTALAASGQTPDIETIDEAWDIIERGPSPSLTPNAQARTIYKAGDVLKRELAQKKGEGADERAETEELIDSQLSKALIPKILQVVHESVPQPTGPLANADSPKAIRDAIASGAPPRAQRNQVTIDELVIRYEADVNLYEWLSIVDVEEPINDPDAELPAIKLEIACRTPNEGGAKFISDTFMNALRQNGRRPGTGFYFDRVYLYEGAKVEAKDEPSISRGPGATGTTDLSDLSPEDVDPVTLEPITDDWRFVIWVDAIMEDYPEPEEEGD